MKTVISLLLGLLLLCSVAYAAAPKKALPVTKIKPQNMMALHNCATCHTLSKEEASELLKDLGQVNDVKTAPVKGLYEVSLVRESRQAIIYVDYGKKLLLPGPVFDIVSKQSITPPPIDLPKIIPQAQLDKLTPEFALSMGNPAGSRRLYVFTDPDCPFCGRLHGELKKLVTLDPELAVFIKLFPLKMHPQAYDKSRAILKAKSLDLLEKAFAAETIPLLDTEEFRGPLDATIKLGEELGIDGTPAMILPNGRFVSGYRDVVELERLLNEESGQSR
jgi:thiol:disulfide interchange protein DsbC